jgi:hypothetical protein
MEYMRKIKIIVLLFVVADFLVEQSFSSQASSLPYFMQISRKDQQAIIKEIRDLNRSLDIFEESKIMQSIAQVLIDQGYGSISKYAEANMLDPEGSTFNDQVLFFSNKEIKPRILEQRKKKNI